MRSTRSGLPSGPWPRRMPPGASECSGILLSPGETRTGAHRHAEAGHAADRDRGTHGDNGRRNEPGNGRRKQIQAPKGDPRGAHPASQCADVGALLRIESGDHPGPAPGPCEVAWYPDRKSDEQQDEREQYVRHSRHPRGTPLPTMPAFSLANTFRLPAGRRLDRCLAIAFAGGRPAGDTTPEPTVHPGGANCRRCVCQHPTGRAWD